MLLVWENLWAVYERDRVWCLIVRETCEYHSRGEEYMVLFWRDPWVPQQTRRIWCIRGGLCQLLTDNLFFVMIYNFVQKCIMLAKNNVMSVLTPIWLRSLSYINWVTISWTDLSQFTDEEKLPRWWLYQVGRTVKYQLLVHIHPLNAKCMHLGLPGC